MQLLEHCFVLVEVQRQRPTVLFEKLRLQVVQKQVTGCVAHANATSWLYRHAWVLTSMHIYKSMCTFVCTSAPSSHGRHAGNTKRHCVAVCSDQSSCRNTVSARWHSAPHGLVCMQERADCTPVCNVPYPPREQCNGFATQPWLWETLCQQAIVRCFANARSASGTDMRPVRTRHLTQTCRTSCLIVSCTTPTILIP